MLKNLPELTAEERAAMESLDMTPVLGTPEEQVKVAMDAAIRFMRERNQWQRYAAYCNCCAKSGELPMDFDAFRVRSVGAAVT